MTEFADLIERLERYRTEPDSAWEGCVANQNNDLFPYESADGLAIAPLRFVAHVDAGGDIKVRKSLEGAALSNITNVLRSAGYIRLNPYDCDPKLFGSIYEPYFRGLLNKGNSNINKRREFFNSKRMTWWLSLPATEEIGISPQDAAAVPAFEGASKQVTSNRYERNKCLREACIKHYRSKWNGKLVCEACEFDFHAAFGDLGEGFIHIHHQNSLGNRQEEHLVDPIKDLVPLCPNCHAMAHRKVGREAPPRSIQELQGLLRNPGD